MSLRNIVLFFFAKYAIFANERNINVKDKVGDHELMTVSRILIDKTGELYNGG